MGWLWNKTHDLFDLNDGTDSEICICGLSPENVVAAYSLILKNSTLAPGQYFVSTKDGSETGINEAENAAQLVCDKLAKPFHFMTRSIRFWRGRLLEIGFFIFENAIAIDYEQSKLWGEIEISTLMMLILEIMKDSPNSFITLEETVSDSDCQRFIDALSQFKIEFFD